MTLLYSTGSGRRHRIGGVINMRVMDWRALFDKHRIQYIEKGANVKRGELNCRCPWCGNADPSFHLGINLENGFYSCWRNKTQHSGKSPIRLVMKLLLVPYWRARELCGLGEGFIDPEGFDAVAARVMGRDPVETNPRHIKREFITFDKYFRPIEDDRMITRRFWNYLYTRGFDREDIADLCSYYSLRACRDGFYANRLIIPYFIERELVTWTGRAVGPSTVRYLDMPIDDSLVPAKQTLYNHDVILDGGKVLVCVEGPLDTLKLDYYGKPFGVRAVGLSTNSLTDAQTYMLEAAVTQFDYVAVMMDNKTDMGIVDSMKLKDSLFFLPSVKSIPVPAGRGDAGECLPREVKAWAQQLVKGT